MTDRELLELAAKAAGISLITWTKFFGEWKFACNPCGEPWNPLTDDGDALRLAVKLGFHVAQDPDNKMAAVFFTEPDEDTTTAELWKCDPLAATRRAIVRAAAELAKQEAP